MVARSQTQRKPQGETSPWAGKVHCTEVYRPDWSSDRVLACAVVAIGRSGEIPSLVFRDIRVLAGKRPWVAMPSTKIGGEWQPTIEPVDELGAEISRVVLAAFERWSLETPTDDAGDGVPF